MAFVIEKIICPPNVSVSKIYLALNKVLNQSRFAARIENHLNSISIHQVRLLKSKDYCGNHPFACPVRPGGHRPHKKMQYLEGTDWVAFNDMINDVLDKLGVSANVASSLCIIRKGEKRRIEYNGHSINGINNEWDKDSEFYENRIGKDSPRSQFPEGTPGIPEYKS